MASIKNFGLVGIGNDVQFGKGGARLIADAGNTLLFKTSAGDVDAIAKAGELHALGLADAQAAGERIAAIDVAGKIVAGSELINDLANKTYVDDAVGEAADGLDALARAIATAAGITVDEAGTTATVTFTGGLATATSIKQAVETLESSKLNLAGGVMTGQIEMGVAPTDANHLTTKAYVDAAISGLSWEEPVDAAVADIAAADLSGYAVGDRIYDQATAKIFTVETAAIADPATPAVLNAGEQVVEGGAFYNTETDAAYVYNGTQLVQFTGGGSLVGGTGIAISGNVINIDAGNGLGLDTDPATDASKLVVKLAAADSGLKFVDGGLSVDFDVVTAELRSDLDAVQAELDVTQATLGVGEDGALVPFTGAEFLAGKAEVPAQGVEGEDGYVAAIPAVPAPATYHAALMALDSALSAQKSYTDAAIQGLGSMSTQDADAVEITGGSVAADELILNGAHQGSLVFVGADGALESDNAGVSYDATTNTLTVGAVEGETFVGGIVVAGAPATANHLTNKSYVDSAIANAVGGGTAHSARGMHIAFADGVTTLPAFDGLVTRVKIKINTAGTSVVVAAGTSALVPADAVDAEVAGLYIMETADMVGEDGAVAITSVGAAGIMIIEYVEADAVTAA